MTFDHKFYYHSSFFLFRVRIFRIIRVFLEDFYYFDFYAFFLRFDSAYCFSDYEDSKRL